MRGASSRRSTGAATWSRTPVAPSPPLLAAAQAPGAVRSLTLFEPACLGLARGRPAVDEMVAAMAAVFDRSADPELADGEFTHHFLLAMGVPGTDPADPEYAAVGARLRRSTPPWEPPLELAVVSRVRTLVVTGRVERGLRRGGRGARRRGCTTGRRAGTGHGPQFHPDGQAAMAEFQATYD